MKSFKIIYTLFFVLIISSCDMITEDVQSDVDLLQTELENLQTQINEMESQLNERDSQISDANNQINDLSNSIDDLSGSLDSNIVYLTQQINDLSNSIDSTDSSLLKEISDLTILLQTLTTQYNELQVSVISIESSISSMDSDISSVANRLYDTVVTLYVDNVTTSMYESNDYPNDLYIRSDYIGANSHVEIYIRETSDYMWREFQELFSATDWPTWCDGDGVSAGSLRTKYLGENLVILETVCDEGLVGWQLKIVVLTDTY